MVPASLGFIFSFANFSLFYFHIFSLRSVDLSQNKIVSLPGPMHWKSLNLRELLFNHNQIDVLDLSEKACAWSRLEKLHLSHNKLKEVKCKILPKENLIAFQLNAIFQCSFDFHVTSHTIYIVLVKWYVSANSTFCEWKSLNCIQECVI